MTNKKPPWNKGKKGIEAGWTEKRRKQYSERQKAWLKAHPEHPYGHPGPRVDKWKTGPDPAVRKHYYRFLKARNQAKFWKQEWTLTWEDYLDLFKTASGTWSRDKNALNLTRVNTKEGWHLSNIKLMKRIDAMRRKTTNKREKPDGLGKGRHHWTKKKK